MDEGGGGYEICHGDDISTSQMVKLDTTVVM